MCEKTLYVAYHLSDEYFIVMSPVFEWCTESFCNNMAALHKNAQMLYQYHTLLKM